MNLLANQQGVGLSAGNAVMGVKHELRQQRRRAEQQRGKSRPMPR
jgi:uncharacterized protein YoaH (UPF0181 family)